MCSHIYKSQHKCSTFELSMQIRRYLHFYKSFTVLYNDSGNPFAGFCTHKSQHAFRNFVIHLYFAYTYTYKHIEIANRFATKQLKVNKF